MQGGLTHCRPNRVRCPGPSPMFGHQQVVHRLHRIRPAKQVAQQCETFKHQKLAWIRASLNRQCLLRREIRLESGPALESRFYVSGKCIHFWVWASGLSRESYGLDCHGWGSEDKLQAYWIQGVALGEPACGLRPYTRLSVYITQNSITR